MSPRYRLQQRRGTDWIWLPSSPMPRFLVEEAAERLSSRWPSLWLRVVEVSP